MENPWANLPSSPPFVGPADADILSRLGPRLQGKFALQLDLLPQHWTGNVNTAEILMLALNPGYSEQDHVKLRNPEAW